MKPKARPTPRKPIPSWTWLSVKNSAARTALPQPPNTSQNVPRNSAPSLATRDRSRILLLRVVLRADRQSERSHSAAPSRPPPADISDFQGLQSVPRRAIDPTAAGDEDRGRSKITSQGQSLVQEGHGVHVVPPPCLVPGDDEGRTARQRPADRVVSLATHDQDLS